MAIKFEKNLISFLNYLLSNVKTKMENFQIFVAFSEYLNFTYYIPLKTLKSKSY